MTVKPLEAKQLCHTCDAAQFDFQTTEDLEELSQIIGQERATDAVRFGIGIRRTGYNLFALGRSGTGKRTTISQFLEGKAADEPVPSDWCYVNNFEDSHKPNALRLPPGKGIELREDIDQLLEELGTAIPATFESEDYQTRRQESQEEFQEKQEKALNQIQAKAKEKGIALIRTPVGLAFAPVEEGEVVSPDEFQKLPEEKQEQVKQDIAELQEELQETMRQARQWERRAREKVKELDRQVAMFAVGHRIEELQEKYADVEDVLTYLEAIKNDVVENVDDFRRNGDEEREGILGIPMQRVREARFRRYQVNVLVDHSESTGAPVIFEEHPTYNNLIGRIEHIAQMGALVTDFNLIKPGALHKANGGYLLIDARELLTQPYAWEGLKRVLRAQEVRTESLSQALSLVSTVSLEPKPIPLNVKVVLIGERLLYYLLNEYDPDFGELFKVEADFNDEMSRTPETNQLYARLIATMASRNNLRPFDRAAVARTIQHSSRISGDSKKLSTHLLSIADLLHEADYWAGEAGNGVVTLKDVQKAIDQQINRADRIRERTQENIKRGTILIDTEGERIGQVNGLSVIALGNFAFGRPSRITARTRLGKGNVVDIEREVELGGPIHSKGVLILSGYLGARYAPEYPLSLSASLVFEQSYAGVEGDSASLAELCALLSALADVPVRQTLAVTGSVNQHGDVQPIGGVNEKIEGFFDTCTAKGLTGDQGVLIPTANVEHLMLRRDVIEAVAQGEFSVYAVQNVDEAIELLTGVPAGERNNEGAFPEGTINQCVEARLIELAQKQRDFADSFEEESSKQPTEDEASEATAELTVVRGK
ncbi:MAG: ATP-binding protein [Anaerolineae bacterium]|jgi:lon-related putative ATP-dependent protease